MTRAKEIKELARLLWDLDEQNVEGHYKVAEKVYNAGYRKVPQDAVVVRLDDVEELAETIVNSQQIQRTIGGIIKEHREDVAKTMWAELKAVLKYTGKFTDEDMDRLQVFVKELATTYGVDL